MNFEPDSRFVIYKRGAVLAPNVKEVIATVIFKVTDNNCLDEIHEKIPLIRLEVKYKSAYGENFFYNSDDYLKSYRKIISPLAVYITKKPISRLSHYIRTSTWFSH